jgi:hypothetical protein
MGSTVIIGSGILSPLCLNMALPVSRKIDRLATLHCQRRYAAHLIAIRDAAVMGLRCLVIALAFFAAFASDSWGQSKQPSAQSKQPAQPPAADQRGTDQVPLTVKILPAQDAKEKADKEERERQEKAVIDEKLAFETQRIADYTDRLAAFTIALFCIAVFQAGLFFWQLRYMRKGMEDAAIAAGAAKESADTAKIQAGVARDTLQTMQDTAERQLRAYVGVSGASISKVETGAPEAIVTFKNFGQTPAYDVRSWIHMWIAENPLTVTVLPNAPADFQKSSGVVYPGSHFIHVMPKEPPVPQASIHLLGTPAGTIYVYGCINYRDAFKQDRTTKFRLMYGGTEPVRGNLLKHDREGNEAD